MRTDFYMVEMVAADGSRSLSQTFATKRAATKRAEWCRAQRWCTAARVMVGGPGGMEVA